MIFNGIKVLVIFFAIANMSACANVAKDLAEDFAQPKKTQSLDSSPETTGILAIEVELNDPYCATDITLAKINEKDGSQEKYFKVSSADTPKPKRSVTSMLRSKDIPPAIMVYNGLEPGKYFIKEINLSGAGAYGWYRPEVTLDIKEGQPKCVCIDITITSKFLQKTKATHVVADDPSREVDVWVDLLVAYPNSAWQSIIQQRIDKLRAQ